MWLAGLLPDSALRPEERVRQVLLKYLRDSLGYSPAQLATEVPVKMGSDVRRVDIGISRGGVQPTQHTVFLVVECKKRGISESEFLAAVEQLKSYMAACGNAHFGVAYDGDRCVVLQERKHSDGSYYHEQIGARVEDIPAASAPIPRRFTAYVEEQEPERASRGGHDTVLDPFPRGQQARRPLPPDERPTVEIATPAQPPFAEPPLWRPPAPPVMQTPQFPTAELTAALLVVVPVLLCGAGIVLTALLSAAAR